MSEAEFLFQDTDKLLKAAKQYIDNNPGIDLAFTQIANVIVNGNTQTLEMSKWAFMISEADSLHVDMFKYAYEISKYAKAKKDEMS